MQSLKNVPVIVSRLCGFASEYEQTYFKDLKEKSENPSSNCAAIQNALQNPYFSGQVFFGKYAFERAGASRAGYDIIACKLLQAGKSFPSASELWQGFEAGCNAKSVKPNERLNKTLLEQGYEKNFGQGRTKGWLFELGQAMVDKKKVLPAYLELLDIPGIGPKIAAFLCRDLAWIFGCEKDLPASERRLLQPVDTWIRQIAVLFWPQFEPMAHRQLGQLDFLIAEQIVALADNCRESGVAFNQGSWYFGNKLGPSGNLENELQQLAN